MEGRVLGGENLLRALCREEGDERGDGDAILGCCENIALTRLFSQPWFYLR